MTVHALAGFAAALALAATPVLAAADDAPRVRGDRYWVVNQTGAPLSCRFRVNSGGSGGSFDMSQWTSYPAIAEGGQFTRFVAGPGETITLDCGSGAKQFTVRPGQGYNAAKAADGKLTITPV